jgi:hypothetical protein
MKKLSLTLLILTVIISGCDKAQNENAESPDYVMYGTSFGECLGYCRKSIKIEPESITFTKSGWNIDSILPEQSETDNFTTENWEKLTNSIDFEAFLALDPIIGCPDCADGGAEWIEIKRNDATHKVIFEYNHAPDAVKSYIGILKSSMEEYVAESK